MKTAQKKKKKPNLAKPWVMLWLIGIVGWFVYSQQGNQAKTSLENTRSNPYFTFTLPEGWRENLHSEVTGGAAEAEYSYEDGNGRSIHIGVNPADFGGGGDGSARFEIIGNTFQFDETYGSCDPNRDIFGVCRYGDGKLNLMARSASTYKGNYYYFVFKDDSSESNEAYREFAKIIETIKLK